jgi:hypothetical protein
MASCPIAAGAIDDIDAFALVMGKGTPPCFDAIIRFGIFL